MTETTGSAVWPPYMASSDVQRALVIAERVAKWNEERLLGVEVHTNDINRLAVGSFAVVHEHQKASLVLTRMGLMGPAMALMRPLFEAFVRGLWLQYATNGEFARYQKGQDSLDLERAAKLVRQRSGNNGYMDLVDMWKASKKTLHGYVHQSFQALIRRSGDIELPIEDVVSTLNFGSAMATHASIEITNIMDRDALPENKVAVRNIVNELQIDLVTTLMTMGLANIPKES